MINKNYLISASAYDKSNLKYLDKNNLLDRVHVGCVEDNYVAINKSQNITNSIPHILLNRIDSRERVKYALQKANINSILLLTGNPHKSQFSNDFDSTINYFSDFFSVYVAAYPTSQFGTQSRTHLKNQSEIIKRKIDCGAKEIYLQSTNNTNKLETFIKYTRSNQINVPFHYGILPNVSFQKIYENIKKIVPNGKFLFHKNNLDFLYNLIISSEKHQLQLISYLKENNLCLENDGFHITSLDMDISSFLKKINFEVNK